MDETSNGFQFDLSVFDHPDGLAKMTFRCDLSPAEVVELPLGTALTITVLARETRVRETLP